MSYCAAARSSSCSSIAFVRQRRAPALRGQVVAGRPGQPLRIRVVEGQRVGRDVVRRERERRVQRRRPGLLALPGDVVQQVERHRPDARLASLGDRGLDVPRAVSSAQPPQQPVIERLRAQRDPRHARVDERPRVAAFVRPGVRLDRDLGARGQPEPGPDAIEDGRDRRRTAAASACRRRGTASRAADGSRPNAASAASARRSISVSSAPTKASTRARGPRAAAPA